MRIPSSTATRLRACLAVAALVAGAACTDADAHRAPSTSSETPSTARPTTDAELAAEAYVAGYPLVVTTRTLQHFAGLLGVNRLAWQPALAGPASRAVVAPNRDTLYSLAVLDLRSEPVALTLPAITDRYYTYQLLDAWSESFAYLGTRATGGRAGTWVITGPGWEGDLPPGVERIESTTSQLLLLGRYLVDDEADIANVHALREQVRLEPLSALTGGTAPPPPAPIGEPAGAAQAVPTDASFFAELGPALAVNAPTTPHQRDLFDQATRLGIGPGAAPGDHRRLLDEAAAEGDRRITEEAARQLDGGGWEARSLAGRYGDDLLQRAVVARIGWGANIPEEAVYPIARTDAAGDPLDGAHAYRVRFPAGALPPVDAFWSLTVYGPDMFFVEHPSGRYSIGDRTAELAYGDDGSLEVVISHAPPAPGPDGRTPNWLPSPEGPFVLMFRLYLPRPEVLAGDYRYPPVERIAPERQGDRRDHSGLAPPASAPRRDRRGRTPPLDDPTRPPSRSPPAPTAAAGRRCTLTAGAPGQIGQVRSTGCGRSQGRERFGEALELVAEVERSDAQHEMPGAGLDVLRETARDLTAVTDDQHLDRAHDRGREPVGRLAERVELPVRLLGVVGHEHRREQRGGHLAG
jgi:hypothetical protein